jgi:hypothetical protein
MTASCDLSDMAIRRFYRGCVSKKQLLNGFWRYGNCYLVPIQKPLDLVEIKAREKFSRRHMVDIPRIPFFAQRRY